MDWSAKDRLSAVAARYILATTTSPLVQQLRRCTGRGSNGPVGFLDEQRKQGTAGSGRRKMKGILLLVSHCDQSPWIVDYGNVIAIVYDPGEG